MKFPKLILGLLIIVILAGGIAAYGDPSGHEEGTVTTIGGGGTYSAGERNVILQEIAVIDTGGDNYPLDIEQVCVQATDGTLPGRYIQQLKLILVGGTLSLAMESGGVNAVPDARNFELWLLGPFPNGISKGTIQLDILNPVVAHFRDVTGFDANIDEHDALDQAGNVPPWGAGTTSIQITFTDTTGPFWCPPGSGKCKIADVELASDAVGITQVRITAATPWGATVAAHASGAATGVLDGGLNQIGLNPWTATFEVNTTLPGDYTTPISATLPATEGVLGIVRRPDFSAPGGVCFGTLTRLLFEVPDGGVRHVRIEADLRYDAPDGLTFRPVTTFIANDGLIGGSAMSSAFTDTTDTATGNFTTIQNATGAPEAQVTFEDSMDAEPGAKDVVLGQFLIEDFGGDGNPTLLQSVVVFLQGLRYIDPLNPGLGKEVNNDVLNGINSVSLYVETPRTGPGFQTNDRRLVRISRPLRFGDLVDLDGDGTAETLELVMGRRGRTLMRIDDGSAARFYIVADLGTELRNGDEIALKIIPGAGDGRRGGALGAVVSSRIDLTPGTFIDAINTEISGPMPTLVIGEATIPSDRTGKLTVSMKDFPAPGLDSMTVVFVYDPTIAEGTYDILHFPNVHALGNYEVLSADIGLDGTMTVTIGLKVGRKPQTGDFDLLEIEFEALGSEGEETTVTAVDNPLLGGAPVAMDADGNDVILDVVDGKIKVQLLKGDVYPEEPDGIVTRLDAREVALFIVGRSTLSWDETRQKAADVVAPFCSSYPTNPTKAPACIDASDVRAIMLAAYGLISLSAQAQAIQPLRVNAITLAQNSDSFSLIVSGQGVASVGLQLYNLAGGLVLDKEAQGNVLQFQALDNNGQALANGIYLYAVTVRGYDGKVIRSEVRKLVILN